MTIGMTESARKGAINRAGWEDKAFAEDFAFTFRWEAEVMAKLPLLPNVRLGKCKKTCISATNSPVMYARHGKHKQTSVQKYMKCAYAGNKRDASIGFGGMFLIPPPETACCGLAVGDPLSVSFPYKGHKNTFNPKMTIQHAFNPWKKTGHLLSAASSGAFSPMERPASPIYSSLLEEALSFSTPSCAPAARCVCQRLESFGFSFPCFDVIRALWVLCRAHD